MPKRPYKYKAKTEEQKRLRAISDKKYYAKNKERRKEWAHKQYLKDKESGVYDRRYRKKKGLPEWRGVKMTKGPFTLAFD
jgi:hypothetical protein